MHILDMRDGCVGNNSSQVTKRDDSPRLQHLHLQCDCGNLPILDCQLLLQVRRPGLHEQLIIALISLYPTGHVIACLTISNSSMTASLAQHHLLAVSSAERLNLISCNLKGMPVMSTRTTLLSVRPCFTEDDQQAYLKRKIVAQHRLQVICFLCLHSREWVQAA